MPEPPPHDIDDPSAPDHAAWHSLVGHFVALYVHGPKKRLHVFEVTSAAVQLDAVFLLIRPWPGTEDIRVGGVSAGTYAMVRRPDGGFQVAGDKLVLVGSRRLPTDDVLEQLSTEFTPSEIDSLRTRLMSPPHDVRMP